MISKEEQEFLDALNGVNEFKPKPKFGGTGMPGKTTRENVWSSNTTQYKEQAGQFGKTLAQWVKQEQENKLLVDIEDIKNELRKEGKYNGK